MKNNIKKLLKEQGLTLKRLSELTGLVLHLFSDMKEKNATQKLKIGRN